ncbi:MAG: Hint domain-containing protein [Pseudomonadota bacterium]
MRRYSYSFLRSDGSVDHGEQIAPAIPAFEVAFSAFAHGALMATPDGHTAIQDLVPGMHVSTQDGEKKILWTGSMTLMPRSGGVSSARLYRVMPDAFGVGRPAANLLVGPGARLMTRPLALRDTLSCDPVLTPCMDLVDGTHVIEIAPPRPVTVFHIALDCHAILRADGIEADSFHPGPGFERMMDPALRGVYLSLFPHINAPGDFGALRCRRLPLAGV